jgi:hypothetical protein
MKYSELVDFDPIESVVELRAADKADAARRLVQTFVISDRMAELLTEVVFPQMQFGIPTDNKGMMVVGNYGTGKSHLMAIVSAIAERNELVASITNADVAKAAQSIAGKFRVIRAEAPSTQLALRDLVCQRIERWLADEGIDFSFPPYEKVTSNKDDLQEMMAKFEQKHPEKGLLFVLDELLDYLKGRDQQALIRDLGFLRELGEVCKTTRFRFMAGVQETLFNNPRFQFVADSLKRVSQRFEQVLIVREDIAFVVSRRLLRKTAAQEAKIREHLSKFTKLYGSMNERLDDFVRLYPVHPAYLGAFERVTVAEKREILKTLSRAIKRIINSAVPTTEPGVIAYDSYWAELRADATLKSDPDIREVIEKSKVLEDRVDHAFPKAQRKAVAMRVVHGLSVHRLTTGDIHNSIGATAEELRDDLCLHVDGLPEQDAEFLRTVIESVLKDTMKTVNGQFLSVNAENGQYFLDLKKDIDFDSLIEKRGETLSNNQLDQYYFDALGRVIECADQTSVPGYKIWEHEVEWRDRKAGRNGYLFFGAPNERSTAQPPRDFYMYFLQPFDRPSFTDEKKPDEVFFRLQNVDDKLKQMIRMYGGAREQATSASGKNKELYEAKARDHLRDLTKWLRENLQSAFQVVARGKSASLAETVRGKVPSGGSAAVRDFVNTAGSVLLDAHFADIAPEYPTFSVQITKDNRDQAAQDALRIIGGAGVRSKNGLAVLDALELLDGDRLKPSGSRYAKSVLDELSKKPHNQVLNRSELVRSESTIDYWQRYRMEPEFLLVVLASLVYSGEIVLSVPGKKLDASAIDQFGKVALDDLVSFKHIERPKDLPIGPIKDLFTLLGIPEGLIVDPNNRDAAVQRLQTEVAGRVKDLVTAQSRLSQGLVFWGQNVLTDAEAKDRGEKLASAKTFLEGLQAFNSPGKLKNFPHTAADVKAQQGNLIKLVNDVGPQTSYIETAEQVLPADHAWREKVKDDRSNVLKKVTSAKHRADLAFQRELGHTLSTLKGEYKKEYIKLFQRCRLGQNGDKRKGKLAKDSRIGQLRKLAGVEMMPNQDFRDFEDRLLGFKSDWSITEALLDGTPVYAEFRPVDEVERFKKQSAEDQLTAMEEQLDRLVANWTKVLKENLSDPTIKDKLGLITNKAGREAVQAFIKSGNLPEEIDNTFIKALQEVLSGLEKVGISSHDVTSALTKGGMPCTPEQLQDRFESYIKSLTKGKDAAKLRIVIE